MTKRRTRAFAEGGRPWLRCSLCKVYRAATWNGAYCKVCSEIVASLPAGAWWLTIMDVLDPAILAMVDGPSGGYHHRLDDAGRLVRVSGAPQWQQRARTTAAA